MEDSNAEAWRCGNVADKNTTLVFIRSVLQLFLNVWQIWLQPTNSKYKFWVFCILLQTLRPKYLGNVSSHDH